MTKISKILYLITQSEWGGAQRYIFDLATSLPKDRYSAVVAAGLDEEKASQSHNLFTKLDEKSIKSYGLNNLVREINPLKDLKAYFEIKKLLKEIKPDILHLNSSKAGVIGAMAGRRAGIKKIIYTVHGFVFNEPLPTWKKLFYLWAEKFSARYKDQLICVSEFDRQTGIHKNIAPADKFITVHNGLNPVEFMTKAEARSQLNLPAEKKIIGTLAHFYPTKNLKSLIQAANIVIKKYPETTFAIIGDGQLRPELEAEISGLQLNKKIVLLGEKPQAYRYLTAFDIYACSSIKEGLPYSIIEAMQAGLPVVSSKVGGIPEIITDEQNGLLVNPGDPDDLAKAIINILEDEKLAQKLSQQARTDLLTKFSLTQMVSQTETIYQG